MASQRPPDHLRRHATIGCGLLVFSLCLAKAEPIPEEIVRDLTREEFRIREDAQARLLEWSREDPSSRASVMLMKARMDPDPEVRQRSHNVLFALAMDDYLKDGEGFLGIQMVAVRAEIPAKNGADEEVREVIAITRVLRGTPALDAGLRVGDMIALVDGVELAPDLALPSFQQMIKEMQPGKLTKLGIIRNGEWMEIELKLGRRPPEQQGRLFGQPFEDLNELAKRDQDRFFKQWLGNLDK